jgi:hypothetical protein
MRRGMYIIAPKPISAEYFIHSSHQSVCLYVSPPIVARQRICTKLYRRNENTLDNRVMVGWVVFYAVRAVLKKAGDCLLPEPLVSK